MGLQLGDIEKYSRGQYLEAFDMVKDGTLYSKEKKVREEIREIALGIRFFRRKYSMQTQNILDMQQMVDYVTETSTDIEDVKIMSWMQKQLSYCGEELKILKALNNTAVVQSVNKDGVILHINDIYEKVSGDTRNLLGKNIKGLGGGKYHPPEFWKDMWDTILSGQVWQGVIKNPRMDIDGFYYVHTTITPIKGKNGEYDTFIAVKFDVTALKELEKDMADSRNRLHKILNSTSQGFWVINEKLEIQDINDSFCTMVGYDKDEIIGRSIYDFFDTESRKVMERQAGMIKTTEHRTYDVSLKKKNGTLLPIKLQATTIWNDHGEITDIVAFMVDVSDLIEASKKDALTGISNRRCFDNELKECYTLINQGDLKEISLAMIDIDHFKNINDTYGHAIGDDVLGKMGSLLNTLSNEKMSVFRYGGEEFVLIGRDIDTDTMKNILEKFRMEIEKTNTVSGKENIKFTISVGVAGYKAGDTYNYTPEKISKLADTCLYFAKHNGRNRVITRRDI